ncbi:MAG: SEC-C metal-binding domain-containing protein, partial [Patescibacteria group bacterium]
ERHESRRIDNQLRGRSGRQGDPGETRFFVSLEDDLMRIFGGEQISKLMTFFNLPEDQPLTHSMVSKAIEQAQVKVEGHNFDIRKHLVEFDDVLSKQREIVYELRRKLMALPEKDVKEFRKTIFDIFSEQLNSLILQFVPQAHPDKEAVDILSRELNLIISIPKETVEKLLKQKNEEGLVAKALSILEKQYKDKEKEVGEKVWNDVVRAVFLNTIDTYFTEHLTSIDELREGIGLRAYGQMDPLVQYKNEAYTMFESMLRNIYFETMRRIGNIQIENAPQIEGQKDHKHLTFSSASSTNPYSPQEKKQETAPRKVSASQEKSSSGKKPGRNDPCWCGSGKKYKKCHYPD